MARNTAYLYGKNSVCERLKANPESIKRVCIQENFNSPQILQLLAAAGITPKKVSEREISKLKRADRLQGIVAEVSRFQYTLFDELVADTETRPSLIFLDNINDPHNLGSIIRITACLGGFGIVVPRHSSCEVNDTVMHVASGGENFTPVSVVSNIPNALRKAKEAGYWILGTVVDGGEDIREVSIPFPACIVLGSEVAGIRHGVEKTLDKRITLPMQGAELSLNVAMASAIFCYEIVRQRQKPT